MSNLWNHLRLATQQRILALGDQAGPDERAGVADALGKLLPQLSFRGLALGHARPRDQPDHFRQHGGGSGKTGKRRLTGPGLLQTS